MDSLRLHWLGLPAVELRGRPVKLETRKSTALLAYLSTGGEKRQREVVATMFWPEGNQQRALASLRRTLSSLNSRLPGWMEADRETINLKQGNKLWTDVATWQGLLGRVREHCQPGNETCEACRSLLEEALHLYRGDFLEGLILGDAPVFDDWQFFQRESLRGELAQVLERLAQAYARVSQWDQAVESARRWVSLDPLNEPANRALMDLFARSGQRAAAVHQYEELGRLLQEQTQQQPEPETREMYDKVRGQDRAGAAMPSRERPTSIPLLRTKLYIPAVPTSLVRRARLVDLLGDVQNKALTLISAPAGFGKTTLLAEWIAETSLPVAWISLDAGDNDPYRFLTYLIAALQSIREDIGVQAEQIMQSPQVPQPGIILTSILNDLGRLVEPCALVLDDYQFITELSVHELVAYLLDHSAPGLHLVIATRADPALQLGKLRGYEKMLELRIRELRFSPSEASALLNDVMRLGLSGEDIRALETRTEGWVVGLQMAAISLKGHENAREFIRAFSGSHRYVLDYLLEEVLKRQPAHIQRFLLDTSILEKLSGPLCDALMTEDWRQPGQTGQDILEYLERSNLFVIPLDENKRWYRYHHLFADLLRSRMMQSAGPRAAVLHLQASHWYESAGLHVDAIQHALAAKDDEYAIALIEEHAGDLIFAGNYFTILEWIRKLPALKVRGRPWLSLWSAWGTLAAGKIDGVDTLVQEAEMGLAAATDGEDAAGQARRQELSREVLAIRTSLTVMQGDHLQTIQLAQHALNLLPLDDVRHRVNVLYPLGNAYYALGELAKAERSYQDVFALALDPAMLVRHILATYRLASISRIMGDLPRAYRLYMDLIGRVEGLGLQEAFGMSFIYLGLGSLQFDWNWADEAWKTTERGVRLGQRTAVPMVMADGSNCMLRILIAAGKFDSAEAMLHEADGLMLRGAIPAETKETLEANRVRLWLAQGDLVSAAAWGLDRQRPGGVAGSDFEREPGDIALARVLLAQGAQQQAHELLDRLEKSAEAGGRRGRLLEILLLRAYACQIDGRLSEAMDCVGRSLELGQAGNWIRTFVDEGDWLAELLGVEHQGAGGQRPDLAVYIATLEEAIHHEAEAAAARTPK